MAFVTGQQLDTYYDKYKKIDVTFTKDVTKSLRMLQNHIHLKYKGGQRSCVIYSSSLCGSKIIIALPNKLLAKLQTTKLVYLRYCFQKEDSSDIVSFIVHSRIVGFTQYGDNDEVYFAQLEYTHRPPDILIEILGAMLDANVNAKRRKEERIIIDTNNIRRLNLVSNTHTVRIDKTSRNGLLRDISFSGLKIIISGDPVLLIGKKAKVKLSLTFGRNIELGGKIIRHESVENHNYLVAIVLRFEPEDTPLEYRMLVNDCLRHQSVTRIRPRNEVESEDFESCISKIARSTGEILRINKWRFLVKVRGTARRFFTLVRIYQSSYLRSRLIGKNHCHFRNFEVFSQVLGVRTPIIEPKGVSCSSGGFCP